MTLRKSLILFEQRGFAKKQLLEMQCISTTFIFSLLKLKTKEAAVTDWELKRYFERI